jgi:hypothetical protein
MTEVIEHIEGAEAAKLVEAVLRTNFSKVVITVPNRDFNINYNIGPDEMRHSDHKWEPNLEEFHTLMDLHLAIVKSDLLLKRDSSKIKLTVSGIGDSVNNVHSVLMATFERIKA